jgi:hypothetical protein
MPSPQPRVVVYGASGYTGKLIAEYLARARIPFVAAGRDAERVRAAMASVPGLERVEVPVAAVAHERTALRRLFTGAAVVVNVVGPFGQLGRPVAEAALDAGCHYLDTTGEQDWVKLVRDELGAAFAARDLLVAPATAWMWAAGQLVAEACLDVPGVDSLDIVYAPNGAPTIASTLSFLRMCTKDQYLLVNGALATWPAATAVSVTAPHTHDVLVGLPWGGGCEPLWYEHDPRVRNVRVVVGFPKNPFVDWLLGKMTEYVEVSRGLTPAEAEELTNAWGREIAFTPPREIEDVNRCVVTCRARGRTVGVDAAMYGTAPYLQTGALAAEATRRLLAGMHGAVGFASPAAAFGPRALSAALEDAGLLGPVRTLG